MARVYVERRELPAGLLRLLDAQPATADCTPPLDIVETEQGFEAVLDIPGVPRESVAIVISGAVLLITGQKRPSVCRHRDAAFHMAERSFGRFARAISLDGPIDVARATATLSDGELRVFLPRVVERRGVEIRIPIQPAAPPFR